MTFLLFSLPLSATLAFGQRTTPLERTYNLPCNVTSFSQSGDGALIWFACQDQSLQKRWETDAAEARKRKQPPPPPPVTLHAHTDVYALEVRSGRATKLADVEGRIAIAAAPVGTQMVLVLPQERGNGQPVLYDGIRKVTDLPIDPYLLVWSADASKIYFYGGTTIEADAWNILGVMRLNGLVVSREKLMEATESVHICAANGHLFTGDPFPNDKGQLTANTVEYDPDAKSARPITKFLPGNFSATCRYVATDQSSHGPLAWEIIDVATGRRLMHFEFTAEGTKEEFEFHSWNPKRDDIFLRFLDQPVNSETEVIPSMLQIFDLQQQRVLESFDDIPGTVAWSKDGRSIIFSRANSLVLRPIFRGD
jgi:hypothetical protein